MADDAIITTAFAQRGLVAEWAIGWLLTRLAGPGVAMDALLSSRRIDGVEAARLGLVNASMPAERLLPHAREYIQQLADRCSPTSLAGHEGAGLGRSGADLRRVVVAGGYG